MAFWFEKAASLGNRLAMQISCYVAKDPSPKEFLTPDFSPEGILRIGTRMRCLVLKKMHRCFSFMWSFILLYLQQNFEKMLMVKEKKVTSCFAWIPCRHVACECTTKMIKCESCKAETKSFVRHVCVSKNKRQKICLESIYARILKIKQENNLVELLILSTKWLTIFIQME